MKKINLLLTLGVCGLILGACGSDEEEPKDTPSSEVVQSSEVISEEKESSEAEKSTEESVAEETSEESESMPEREDVTGKSDKNIDDIDEFSPTDVRNDKTGKWKKVVTAKKIDFPDYALSYANEYMDDDDLVHVIVSFATNTTTTITNLDGMLYVQVREYVDKEEHDANKIGSGMLLGAYNVYKDNGDVQEVEEE